MSKARKYPTFVLLKISSWNHPHWMEDDGSWYRNEMGGGFPKDKSGAKVFETVTDREYENLDHKKTGLFLGVKPDTMDGWCAPDGTFHGCGYWAHDAYADLILKHTTKDLESTGWARCHSHGSDGKAFFALGRDMRITPEQRNTLSKRGFVVEDYR